MAALQTGAVMPRIEPGSVEIAKSVDTVSFRSAKGDLAPIRRVNYAAVEGLPDSGSLVTASITDPPSVDAPALSFKRDKKAASFAAAVGFVKATASTRAVALMARLPQAKPRRALAGVPAERSVATVLAYAPTETSIEAPFKAVMRIAPTAPDYDAHFTPRPRPNPDDVLTWLEGRALGQFAPGQHAWVQNPLPANVHSVRQQKCLAEGIYFEARGESELGQAAVAQVILNRVRAPAYPDTICGVVYQNKSWRNRCQFSFACDGIKDRVRSQPAWRSAVRIAKQVTDGDLWLEEVGDSTHYHANYVDPRWGRTMIKSDKIGAHVFYRTRFGGWS